MQKIQGNKEELKVQAYNPGLVPILVDRDPIEIVIEDDEDFIDQTSKPETSIVRTSYVASESA